MPLELQHLKVRENEYAVEFREEINNRCLQRFNQKTGRIEVGTKGWLVRIGAIGIIVAISAFNIHESVVTQDPLALFSVFVLLHTATVLVAAWLLYKNPSPPEPMLQHTKKVTVIIPVYNQEKMLKTVIDAVFNSTYRNLEVVVVNDGSKDSTAELLTVLQERYPQMQIIHKSNAGKRRAVAKGFFATNGEYVVLIDSDSVIESIAIEELVKCFETDQSIGGLVGCARIYNAKENLITKCQDCFYDWSFMYKACESNFNACTCLSGCLAAYRRVAIKDFIQNWSESRMQYSDDRMLTNLILRSRWLHSAANYDDSEDRLMTYQSLAANWKTKYVASAIVYTEVPATMGKWLNQMQRWRKGYLRSGAFATTFFYRNRHPLMSFIFYADYAMAFTMPAIILLNMIYAPIVLQSWHGPVMFMAGILGLGVAQGLDYKLRVPTSTNWKYKPLMIMITSFMFSWLLIPALLSLRKNNWLTR